MNPNALPRNTFHLFGDMPPPYTEILTSPALEFVAKLARQFEPRRQQLLANRAQRQAGFNAGKLPDFLPETKAIRDSDWKVAPVPQGLQDRRVEITGPTDRKMVINALNSGATSSWRTSRFQYADVAKHDRRAAQPARCCEQHDRVRER